jgi:hypothetical protein
MDAHIPSYLYKGEGVSNLPKNTTKNPFPGKATFRERGIT